MDVGRGKSVTVPQAWMDEHPEIVAAAGGDKAAANGRLSNVECYVLGIDPESETNDFKIVSLPMKADGTPDWENIVYEPAEAKWNVSGARAVLKGAEALGGGRKAVEEASEGDKAKMRFFKVEVELP